MFRDRHNYNKIEQDWINFYKTYVINQGLHYSACFAFFNSTKTIYVLNGVRRKVIYVPFRFNSLKIKIRGKVSSCEK